MQFVAIIIIIFYCYGRLCTGGEANGGRTEWVTKKLWNWSVWAAVQDPEDADGKFVTQSSITAVDYYRLWQPYFQPICRPWIIATPQGLNHEQHVDNRQYMHYCISLNDTARETLTFDVLKRKHKQLLKNNSTRSWTRTNLLFWPHDKKGQISAGPCYHDCVFVFQLQCECNLV